MNPANIPTIQRKGRGASPAAGGSGNRARMGASSHLPVRQVSTREVPCCQMEGSRWVSPKLPCGCRAGYRSPGAQPASPGIPAALSGRVVTGPGRAPRSASACRAGRACVTLRRPGLRGLRDDRGRLVTGEPPGTWMPERPWSLSRCTSRYTGSCLQHRCRSSSHPA